ncbi:MAG: hypothetical protein KDD25_07060 [Bdellovibrionales bacterium]|nr:hypothetical protein [Bdellovibrionales bacterium]
MADTKRLRKIIESLQGNSHVGSESSEVWNDLDHEFERLVLNGSYEEVLQSIHMVEEFIIDAQNQLSPRSKKVAS